MSEVQLKMIQCGRCTTTFQADSLVGTTFGICPKCQRRCADAVAEKWPDGFFMNEHSTNIELQLLIIDLGDSCVIRVEKGSMPPSRDVFNELSFYGTKQIINKPFTEFRAAIDEMGLKPVPRLERDAKGDIRLHLFHGEQGNELQIVSGDYQALCQLAGVEIPIYEPTQGKWTEIQPMTQNVPLAIWRYTR